MFDFKIAKDLLISPLLMVACAVDKRQSLAILSNILLKIDGQVLTIIATDLEIEIAAKLDCPANVTAQTTIPAKKCIDIVRSLEDGSEFTVKQQANSVHLSCGRSLFKLSTLPADDFPIMGHELAEQELQVKRQDLVNLLLSTHFALAQQDIRIYLNALYFEIMGTSITTVATDGHRMAICKLPCETVMQEQNLLLPKKSVQELLRLLNMIEDDEVSLSLSKSFFRLQSNQYTFTSKLVESRYPPYTKVIPRNNDKFVLVDKDTLKKALSRIVILAHEKSRAVLMHIHAGALTLVANNQDQEEATETIEAQVDGNELKIGINASYLLDVLNYLPGECVRLSLSNTDSSILIEALQDENYQYVIMPMKL